MTLSLGHIFQLKERYGFAALVLDPDAWATKLHMKTDELKRCGRGWNPFARVFDARTRLNNEAPHTTIPYRPSCQGIAPDIGRRRPTVSTAELPRGRYERPDDQRGVG